MSDDEARANLIKNICRINLLCMIGGLPGVLLNAWLLWPDVPHGPVLAWSIAHAILIVALIARDLWVLAQPTPHAVLATERLMRLSAAGFGLSIGMSSFLALAGDQGSQSYVINVVTVGLLVNAIVNAGVSKLFWHGQVPLAFLSLLAFSIISQTDGPRDLVLIGAIIAFSCVISQILRHHLEHNASLHRSNADLVNDLLTMNTRLAEDARTDPLTGLLNRAGFVARLEELMSSDDQLPTREGSPQPEEIGVMYLDLDHFKEVNDSLGHAAGDDVLMQTAHRLRAQVRPTDIVARIGGDEFTVAALGIGSIAEAQNLAQRVHRAFENPIIINGQEHQLGASIGVSFGNLESLELDELLASADKALYQAKRNPKAAVAVFDDAARAQVREKREKQDLISAALHDGDIRPHWQPIVHATTGELIGLEGLARWEHDGQIHAAGSFIHELLDAGLEDELARSIIGSALDTRLAIDAEIPLGLNLTPCQLERVLDPLLAQQSMTGFCIEITEQGVLNDIKTAQTLLSTARDRGALVFLDDFGTGYSSLSLIADLPLDGLKIDGRFISTIDNPESYKIVADIADIGRRHGLIVVGEGVETIEQLEMCAKLGITLLQGFLISHPMSTADLKAMRVSGAQPWDHLFENSHLHRI